MSVLATGEETVEQIDECMAHIHTLLLDPKISDKRRNILLSNMDDLLDTRLEKSYGIMLE